MYLLDASLATGLLGLLNFVCLAIYEIFPLWVINDKAHGGFAWTVCHMFESIK